MGSIDPMHGRSTGFEHACFSKRVKRMTRHMIYNINVNKMKNDTNHTKVQLLVMIRKVETELSLCTVHFLMLF
jgi:hypothetical protein